MWIQEHIAELRQAMKDAPARRRELNYRLWPYENMPQPVTRLQPQAEAVANLMTNWATILAGRIGWHGLATTTGGRLFWLLRHRGAPYAVDMAAYHKNGVYILRQDWLNKNTTATTTATNTKPITKASATTRANT